MLQGVVGVRGSLRRGPVEHVVVRVAITWMQTEGDDLTLNLDKACMVSEAHLPETPTPLPLRSKLYILQPDVDCCPSPSCVTTDLLY